MATQTGATSVHSNIGATIDTISLTNSVRQVAIVNTHASQIIYAKAYFAETVAAALALATAASFATGADDTVQIAAGKREVIFKSSRSRCCAIALIASGATTTYACHGSDWFD